MTDETKEKIKDAGKVLLKQCITALVTFGSVVLALFLGQ